MFPRIDGAMEKEFGRVDCIISGHTHRPCNRMEKGVLCFNPGSATGNRFFPFNSVGVLSIGKTITGEIVELRD
jgi:predicted phosphodiesterase